MTVNNQQDSGISDIHASSSQKITDVIMSLLSANIEISKAIFNLCKEQGLLDTQEVLEWQDELNAISVMYK